MPRSKKGGLILRLLLLVLLAYMVIMLVRVRGQITTASNDLDQLTAQVSSSSKQTRNYPTPSKTAMTPTI